MINKIIYNFLVPNFILSLFLVFFFGSPILINDYRLLTIELPLKYQLNKNAIYFNPSIENFSVINVGIRKINTNDSHVTFLLTDEVANKTLTLSKVNVQGIYRLSTYPFGINPDFESYSKRYKLQFLSSKNKPLQFEINQDYPITGLYKFDRSILLDPNKALKFLFQKFQQYIEIAYQSNQIFFYIFPLLIYNFLSLPIISIKKLRQFILDFLNSESIITSVTLIVLLCIYFFGLINTNPSDVQIVVFSTLWALTVYFHRRTPKASFTLALFFVMHIPFFKLVHLDYASNNFAVWTYVFLAFGLLHVLLDEAHARYGLVINPKFYPSVKGSLLFQKKTISKNLTNHNIISISITVIVIISIGFSFLIIFQKLRKYYDRNLKSPRITVVEPMLVYHSTKVVLYGKSFGEKKDERYRIMRNGKEIRTDYWDDSKIIFTIPLDWKPGEYSIWIERPIEWNTETIIEKTKPQTIKVLPVTGKINPDDDLYFKQMDTLRKETKEINGF